MTEKQNFPQLNMKNTKQEMLKAYNELLKFLKEKKKMN